MPKLVRIHPRNPSQGYHAQRYAMSNSPYGTFKVERGWYEVDDKTAAYLATKVNNPSDLRSRPVFQVVTMAEARAIKRAEEEAKRRNDPDNPVPMPAGVAEAEEDAIFGDEGQDWGGGSEALPDLYDGAEEGDLDDLEDDDDPAPLQLEDLNSPGIPDRSHDVTTADLGRKKKAPPAPRKKAKAKKKAPAKKKPTKPTRSRSKTGKTTPKKG